MAGSVSHVVHMGFIISYLLCLKSVTYLCPYRRPAPVPGAGIAWVVPRSETLALSDRLLESQKDPNMGLVETMLPPESKYTVYLSRQAALGPLDHPLATWQP